MLLLSYLALLFISGTRLGSVRATTPTSTATSPNVSGANAGGFVRTEGGRFMLGDKNFQYMGTSAYWLQLLDNDDDMNKTLTEIASLGIKVVRTWAFNDVSDIPTSGVWLRVFHNNGTIEINTGENGILRLDRIVRVAKQAGIHILFSLTNNWFPRVNGAPASGVARRTAALINGTNLPHNYLSNDFGGMDTYVKHFHPNETVDRLAHDLFYSNAAIRNSFQDYVKTIVKRYANEPSVLGWEAANDPRCNSTLPASGTCNPQTITKWTSEISTFIKQNDPNHLVATGDSGFYCVDCTKVFPYIPPPPAPSMRRRSARHLGPLTKAKLLARDDAWKRRNLPQPQKKKLGRAIRGKWSAPKDAGFRKRQSNSFGPVYDGSFGVDTEDLASVPTVDFSSFQFFPDQNTYGSVSTSNASTFDQIVQSGVDWIEQHAATANTYGKPTTLNSFGVVTNVTSNSYAPFNSSTVVQQSGVGTTEQQQIGAYNTWINTAIDAGVQGIIHYQWGQSNLTSNSSPAITQSSGVGNTNTSSIPTYVSPNDGYGTFAGAVKGTLAAGAARIAARTGTVVKRLMEL